MIKFLALILLFISSLIKAQDVHFSQFDKTKSLFNPAIIAHQSDDYQLQLQRRSQWSSVTVPFNTFALSLVAKDLYKDLSAAVTLLNDVAGDSYFSTDGLNFSLSKTFYKKDNFISIGLISFVVITSPNSEKLDLFIGLGFICVDCLLVYTKISILFT